METSALMAISPLDGRYEGKLAGLRKITSEYGLIKFRVTVEIRWLELLAESNLQEVAKLNKTAKQFLDQMIENFSVEDALRVKKIESTINHDVKAVEYFIKEKFRDHSELQNMSEFIHFGCTSEDINNLAYALMLQNVRKECLLPALEKLLQMLRALAHQYADFVMLARTHGQSATPTTLGKEIANVVARLQRQLEQLQQVKILGKMNGASGNYNALVIAYPEINWQQLSETLVTNLGLTFNPYTTQIEPHDYMAEFFAVLIRINTILLDFDRDIWAYISINYFRQKTLANEVGSSTMPHKVNPIDFENSEGNLGIANALLEHMIAKLPVSRWQRDLSDSTVLRNIGVAIGHTLLALQSTCKGVEKLEANREVIAADLDNHWEILAEAVQTVMRRYQLEEPYEKLKAFTRGKKIDKVSLQQFIQDLQLPDDAKKQLLALTPAEYAGYARELAKKI
jgi:adenylosuccinate lyase